MTAGGTFISTGGKLTNVACAEYYATGINISDASSSIDNVV